MRRIGGFFAITVMLLSTSSLAIGGEPAGREAPKSAGESAPRSLADLLWLVGHWRGEALGGVAEEIWLEPAGGAMAGKFRLVPSGRVVVYELFTISEPDLVLTLEHFDHDLSGWDERNETVTFHPVRVTPAEPIFEGLAFRLLPDGRLHASVQARRSDGTESQLDFFLARSIEGGGTHGAHEGPQEQPP